MEYRYTPSETADPGHRPPGHLTFPFPSYSENGCPVLGLFGICISLRAMWVSSVSRGLCWSHPGNGQGITGNIDSVSGREGDSGGGWCQHPTPCPSPESDPPLYFLQSQTPFLSEPDPSSLGKLILLEPSSPNNLSEKFSLRRRPSQIKWQMKTKDR